ncbi:MAG: 1-pyrroline-5-carboxylate dehydrogenase, partial [Chitinophagaceae bacterium]
MNSGHFYYPLPVNEPVLSYRPGSPEKIRQKKVLSELKKTKVDIPMYIGNKEVRTRNTPSIHPPHEISHTLGVYHKGEEKHVRMAIEAALSARKSWGAMSWESRA